MPRTREAVGGGSLDMLGDEQGLVLLNGLRYRPRPAFQSYFAYTPYLLHRNAEVLAGEDAPDFLLVKLDPIDGRLPASEDSLALREAIERYEPVLVERTCLLMRRKAPRASARRSSLLATGEYRWGETIAVPDSPDGVWAEIEVRPTAFGRLIGFLYKPPTVTLLQDLGAERPRGFRLVPQVAREGFLLAPFVDDADSMAALARPAEGRRPKTISLASAPGPFPFFGGSVRASFYSAGL
jgi:hypothetical protein